MLGSQLSFREGRLEDAAALSALAQESKASWGYPSTWLQIWASSLQITSDYLASEIVWVALRESQIAGFFALVRRPGGWLLDHLAFQGLGIGRAMFAHLIGRVRTMGAGIVVIESDPNAAAFYKRMGAREIGQVPAPVEGDPARCLLVLELTVEAA